MELRVKPKFVQICPHDVAPFGKICAAYARAAEQVGLEPITIFLGQAEDNPFEGAKYLNARNVSRALSMGWRVRSQFTNEDRQEGIAIVLCHRYRALKVALWAGMRMDRIVCLAHEYGLLDSFFRRLARRLIARRVRFAGVSPAVAQPLAVVTDYHMVLPNVLATPAHKTRTEARRELGLSNDVFVVGVIGRLHYKKRPALAASAVAYLRQTHDAELVFLGAGDCALVESQAGWIHYAGQRADGAGLIPAFDVVLHTGDVEAFGMVLLEAMAAGVPVAAGRFGGPQFVLGELGFYAQDDTPKGYAGAILAAAGADRSAWREAAIARWEGRFSLASTERRVSELARFLADEEQAQA